MTDLFDPDAEYDARSTDDLVELARSGRTPIGTRARAVTALGRRSAEPEVANELSAMAQDEGMREARMFELVSLAYLAVAGLLRAGTPRSHAAARTAADALAQHDRESLLVFLRSADLTLDGSG